MLSPILAFTADEAWGFLPARKEASVHLSTWPDSTPAALIAAHGFSIETATAQLFRIRDLTLAELEKARQTKLIGKSLDAKVTITLAADDTYSKDDLQELLNVSQLEVRLAKEADVPNLPQVIVEHAEGEKCERCWHWERDVGSHPEHPTICGRCAKAVEQSASEQPSSKHQ